MEPKVVYFKHPIHGDVRLFKEVIRDDERRWLWIKRMDTGAVIWIPKDEVLNADTWEL